MFVNTVTKCSFKDFSLLDMITSKTVNIKLRFVYPTENTINRNEDIIHTNDKTENTQQVFDKLNKSRDFNRKMDFKFNKNFFNNRVLIIFLYSRFDILLFHLIHIFLHFYIVES